MPDIDIGMIVLAAGGSSRMGKPKQLLDFEGAPLVRRAAAAALGARLGPVFVVVGCNAHAVLAALDGLDIVAVRNERWDAGMGTSILAGLDTADARAVDAALFMTADQPLIGVKQIARLAQTYREARKAIVASRYAGTMGIPALFNRSTFGALRRIAPDKGCKAIIVAAGDNAALVDCPEAAVDIDTPEEYARLFRR
jgi:molybdenum cofactor cytidylyltransferase